MSHDATRWAWGQTTGKASAKLVLLAIADRYRAGVAFPSIAQLSADTELDRKTVMSSIAHLETAGIIVTEKSIGSGTRYKLTGIGNEQATSPKNGTGTKNGTSPKNGTAPVPKTGQVPVPKTGHEPVIEPVKNLEEKDKSARASRAAPAAGTRLLAEWVIPATWLAWALDHQPTWTTDHAQGIADSFRDYWAAIPGARGLKTDWLATWRNWVRREGPMRTTQRITRAAPARASPHDALRSALGIGAGDDGHTLEGEYTHETADRRTEENRDAYCLC